MYFKNTKISLQLLKFNLSTALMADQRTFGSEDIRGPNYSGPSTVNPDQMDLDNITVLDEEIVTIEGVEEQEPIEPTKPASRFSCASV